MEKIVICGVSYVQPPCCSFGDYGGAGSLGVANVREILDDAESDVHVTSFNAVQRAAEPVPSYPLDDEIELRELCTSAPPLVIHATGDYGSEAVWLREDGEIFGEPVSALVNSLSNYPVISEERMSEVESEWLDSDWQSWIRSDLERAAWPGDEEPADPAMATAYDALSDDDKRAMFHAAMERENVYPEAEHAGMHVDVDQIAPAWRDMIEALCMNDIAKG